MLVRSLCFAVASSLALITLNVAHAQSDEITSYYQSVIEKIANQPRPQMPVYGATNVTFTVADDGALAAVNVAKSSGNTTLDVTALNLVLSAAPFAAPPEGARRKLSITIESNRPTLSFGDLER